MSIQTAVPVSTINGPNVSSNPTTFLTLSGAGTVWECLDALGDTASVDCSVVVANVDGGGGYDVTVGLDSLVDPGINTGHTLIFRLKYNSIEPDLQLLINIFLLADPAGVQTIIHISSGQLVFPTASGELDAGGLSSSFVQIEIPLTEIEVIAFRAAGGYANSGFLIQFSAFDLFINTNLLGSFDISYAALEVDGTIPPTPLEIEGTGGLIFGGMGTATDYFVSDGGLIFGGEAELYFDPLEYIGEGGFIFGGSAGIGGNQITGTGGFIFGGGGRDFLIRSPDIGGIYFLDFEAIHDTFYLRDGFQGTEDVKIPDPFIQTAYLGD